VGPPSDAIYQDNARNLAAESVRLAFQSAKAEANIITANSKSANAAPPSDAQPTRQQNLSQTAAKIAAQIEETQTKLEKFYPEL
jgi:hypothetical protein